MAFDQSRRAVPDIFRLRTGERLTRVESIVILAIICVMIAIDVSTFFTDPTVNPLASAVSIASTAATLLFLWSPLVATVAMGAVLATSFLIGTESQVLITVALASALVMRLGWTPLILSYTGVFLVATSVMAYGDSDVPVNVGIYLIAATVAGAIGLGLRLAFDRGRRLEIELEAAAEQEREAVLAERRWIAGELHDSIAHHHGGVAARADARGPRNQ